MPCAVASSSAWKRLTVGSLRRSVALSAVPTVMRPSSEEASAPASGPATTASRKRGTLMAGTAPAKTRRVLDSLFTGPEATTPRRLRERHGMVSDTPSSWSGLTWTDTARVTVASTRERARRL